VVKGGTDEWWSAMKRMPLWDTYMQIANTIKYPALDQGAHGVMIVRETGRKIGRVGTMGSRLIIPFERSQL